MRTGAHHTRTAAVLTASAATLAAMLAATSPSAAQAVGSGAAGGPPARPLAPFALTTRTIGNAITVAWDVPEGGSRPVAFEVLEGKTVVARNDTTSAVVRNLPMGSRHSFTVRARDAAGRVSPPSAPVNGNIAPPRGTPPPCVNEPVTDLMASDVTASSLTLRWTDPLRTGRGYDADIGGNRVYIVLVDGVAVAQSWTGRPVHLSGLPAATTVKLSVRASGCSGAPLPPTPVLAVTTAAGPSARPPASPHAVVITSTDRAMKVEWNLPTAKPEGATAVDHWAVYLDGRLAGTADPGATSLMLDGLWWGEVYTVAVVGVDAAGMQAKGAYTDAMLLNCRSSGIAPPRQVKVKAVSASTLTVTWAQDSQPTGTAIYVDGQWATETQALGSTRVTGLAPGAHTVTVNPHMEVRNAPCGNAPASAPVTVTLPAGPTARPGSPTDLTPQVPMMPGYPTSVVTLTWTAPTTGTAPVSYRVYDDAGKRRAASTTTRTTVKLPAGTTTILRVVAVDAAGMESVPSFDAPVHVGGPLVP
ncbi:MAG: fibronectin type III domain-containing protein [Kineosporiaceae bacterium]